MRHLRERIGALTVLAVGQVTHDRYGEEISPGGCAFFGARTAAALGAKVNLLTSVGADFLCDGTLRDLAVDGPRRGRTTVFTNSYPDGGARVQHVETRSPLIDYGMLDEAWKTPDALFVAPVLGEVDPSQPWFSAIEARVRAVCLQGFMKVPRGDGPGRRLVERGPDLVGSDRFAGVDAVFLSEEDVALFGSDALVPFLARQVRHVFVTRGADGSLVYDVDRVSAVGVCPARVVDPTGAGDTFAGAATVGLAAGLSPVDAARLGAAAAAFVVEHRGSDGLADVGGAYDRLGSVGCRDQEGA